MRSKLFALGLAGALVTSAGATASADTDPPQQSHAFMHNWTPVPGVDTCPKSLHDSYSVRGPDGKLYPTWHPARVTDPATGKTCTFGHEHGDDPRTSKLYGWVSAFYSDSAHPDQSGLPFGLPAEASDGLPTAHRHEDNPGHKVMVANDVKMTSADGRGYVKVDVNGTKQTLTCSFLMEMHMGTHSADAFKNNAHELLYAMKCNDGTAVITSTLSAIGNPNEFTESCGTNTVVKTSGASEGLPSGRGARLIPDRSCVDKHLLVPAGQRSDMWAAYEVWQTDTTLRKSDGSALVSYDPWLAVRNPSRFYDGDPMSVGTLLSLRWANKPVNASTSSDGFLKAREWPFNLIADSASRDQKSTDSPFNGARHDFYVHDTRVDNAGGPTTWYTDAYGNDASTTPRAGAVKQYVSSGSNASWPALTRRNFGLGADYGPPGSGVHAPN